ncbi:hypothetical protein FSP39_003199 [Pinctada imbricata]|uniref:THAP-type domain-containing protein n=1 Tax=Pinctada imbricata TaxID=66713 RepID=A0AA89CCH1_PINIB|nr:hypothetical protein FSP39_023921 [Pinctada imbricata]KAK3105683.1 hypothetical protein FSP39_003199 [Pinctada imbricata]
MVKHCCWGTCRSDSRYADREYMSGTTWIPFPKPFSQPDKCRRWVDLCGRKGFSVAKVNKGTYICSKHFIEGKPTSDHPDPLPAVGTSYDIQRAKKRKRRVLIRSSANKATGADNKKKKRESIELAEHTESVEEAVLIENMEVAANEVSIVEDDSVETSHDHDENTHSVVKEEDIPLADHAYCTPHYKILNACSIGCQTDITLADLSRYDNIHMKDEGSMRRSFIMADVLKDDKSCKFYTGISLAVFYLLWNCLKLKASRLSYWRGSDTNMNNTNARRKGRKRLLTCMEEFVMTLMRARRGIDTTTLGAMFGVQPGTVSKIFTTWISFLRLELKFLVSWPTKDQIRKRLPKCCKYFPNTKCIIDCTEYFVQKPSLPSSQRITWSSYKHHNTFKSLVAITPTGSFCFVSDLFTGSISDKRIVEESGFLNHIERGDDIMADRGFLIRGNLALKGATLNIPPFSCNKQLSGVAVTKTRRIARARIHVERAIGRLKCFNVLQGVIPLKVKPIIDQVVFVCAALCNLDKQLVK